MLGADATRSPTSKIAISYSDLPESAWHSSIPGSNAPEVYSSNAPEAAHGPQDFPLEIAPGTELETQYEGSEQVVPNKDLPIENSTKFSMTTKVWAGLVVSIIIVAAIIAGAVGGTLGSRHSSHSVWASNSSDSADNSSKNPSTTSNSSRAQAFASIILKNTSLAAASCPNGDRWVFLQDIQGNVRGCLYSVSSSQWRVLSNNTIPTTAKLGSALGASCEDVPASLSSTWLGNGRYVSVVYINASSNNISQTIFMNGAWEPSFIFPAAGPPAKDTRLSVSTNIVPSLTIGNGTKTSPAYLSSVVIYQQTNTSLIMMNTDPDTQFAISRKDNPVNPNLFNMLHPWRGREIEINSSTGVGFSCIYNNQHLSVSSGIEPTIDPPQLYAQCFIAKSRNNSPLIEGNVWMYNQSGPGIGNYSFDAHKYRYTFELRNSGWQHGFPSTADIVTLPFAQDKTALMYFDSNNTIAMAIGSVDEGVYRIVPPPLPAIVPFGHIGATTGGGNSSILYVYYQVNQSHFGEVSFDNNDGVWSAEPVFVPVP